MAKIEEQANVMTVDEVRAEKQRMQDGLRENYLRVLAEIDRLLDDLSAARTRRDEIGEAIAELTPRKRKDAKAASETAPEKRRRAKQVPVEEKPAEDAGGAQGATSRKEEASDG